MDKRKKAKRDRKLLAITHSDLEADEHAGTQTVADAIAAELQGERRSADPKADSPPPVKLAAAAALLRGKPVVPLQAKSLVRVGSFRVLGYAGATSEDHLAHLAYMSVTVLPLLSARWHR